ncbi:hypothetical protein JCM3766R1_006152 [Sporobolomyces carnicolor]
MSQRRYIVFDGAPSTSECRASINRLVPSFFSTRTASFNTTDLTARNSNQDPVKQPLQSNTVRQRPTQGGRVPDESLCQSFFMFPPPSQPDSLVHGAQRRSQPSRQARKRRRITNLSKISDNSNDEIEEHATGHGSRAWARERGGDEDGSTTFTRHYNPDSIMFDQLDATPSPPSASPQRNRDFSYESNGSYASAFESSSLELSIGPPPNLPWSLHDLTKLDQLRTRYDRHVSDNNVGSDSIVVSVLAMVSTASTKEIASGNGSALHLTEIVLEDETGGIVKLIAWGQQGRELNQVLRTGDLVYFGKVKLVKSRYNQSLELKLIDAISRVGISYRTRIFDPETDRLYTFDRAWATELEQARTVFEIVDWWTKNRE